MPRSQSAYRQCHSTETAVTTVYNEMLLAADGGQVTAVCLLQGLDGGFRHSLPRLASAPS